MSTVDLTSTTFPDTVSADGIVLVDWWATWCGPCQSFAPVYEEASAKHPDITFGKVDTEAEQELAGGFAIQSIPTLMLFRDGILVFSQSGALPSAALEDIIGQARALDMDDIRAKVAAEAEKPS